MQWCHATVCDLGDQGHKNSLCTCKGKDAHINAIKEKESQDITIMINQR